MKVLPRQFDDGFHKTRISECCSKGRGKHKGFVWKYLDEHEEGI
ncbi:NUMOD4 motif family protein [Enterococcus phage EF-P10]|nr:NUMOD4 motif family protein [Enterococcus phage EF-P10]